ITSWQDGIDGDHKGYDGLILGMPDGSCHLEFTHHRDGSPAPIPSRDSLLVFYLLARDQLDQVVARFHAYGHREVEPENPWWANDGHTFEDPDGWRVVLMLGHGVGATPQAFEDRDQRHV
ncbi:MAG TPA: VOC family protein, partial [Thermomicrobiales bacterium]|nr:VOC family protein [Thermomicrobiales bacterium]